MLEEKDADAVSSVDGSFQVADQNEGEQVDVVVKHEGYLDLELPAAVVSGTQPLILTLKTASRVSGKILNENGQPIAGAAVNLMRTRNNAFGRFEAESDADGVFLFKEVSPETYSLAVKAAGLAGHHGAGHQCHRSQRCFRFENRSCAGINPGRDRDHDRWIARNWSHCGNDGANRTIQQRPEKPGHNGRLRSLSTSRSQTRRKHDPGNARTIPSPRKRN